MSLNMDLPSWTPPRPGMLTEVRAVAYATQTNSFVVLDGLIAP